MVNEITFDKLPQAVGYLTEQVERIHKIVAALQPQTAIDKHRIQSLPMREIWLQKCVQCYVEREWHLHQYPQGKFGYLSPLLGVQQGRRQLSRLEHHPRPM